MLQVAKSPDNVVNNALLSYYAHPGMMTDPRDLAFMFTELPTEVGELCKVCLLYTSPSPRDRTRSRMPSSA